MADRDFIQEFSILKHRVDKAFEEIILNDALLQEEKVINILEKLKGVSDYVDRIKGEIIVQQDGKTDINELAFYSGIPVEEVKKLQNR